MTIKDCINTIDSKKYTDKKLESYPTNTDLQTILSDYPTETELQTTLSDYPTTTEMETAIQTAITDIPTGSGWKKVTKSEFVTNYVETLPNGFCNATVDTIIFIPVYTLDNDDEIYVGRFFGFIGKNTIIAIQYENDIQLRSPTGFGSDGTFMIMESGSYKLIYYDDAFENDYIIKQTTLKQDSSTKEITYTEIRYTDDDTYYIKDDMSIYVFDDSEDENSES